MRLIYGLNRDQQEEENKKPVHKSNTYFTDDLLRFQPVLLHRSYLRYTCKIEIANLIVMFILSFPHQNF